MLSESELLLQLQNMMPIENEEIIYRLYGNPAYPQSPWIYGGFKNPLPGCDRAIVDATMSNVRVVVEWVFKDVIKLWSFLDFQASM